MDYKSDYLWHGCPLMDSTQVHGGAYTGLYSEVLLVPLKSASFRTTALLFPHYYKSCLPEGIVCTLYHLCGMHYEFRLCVNSIFLVVFHYYILTELQCNVMLILRLGSVQC